MPERGTLHDHLLEKPRDRGDKGTNLNGLNGFDGQDEGLSYRRRYRGLIGVHSKVPIRDRAILSLIYTPGVAEACLAISQDPLESFDLTCRGNTVAILPTVRSFRPRSRFAGSGASDRRRQERHLQNLCWR